VMLQAGADGTAVGCEDGPPLRRVTCLHMTPRPPMRLEAKRAVSLPVYAEQRRFRLVPRFRTMVQALARQADRFRIDSVK